MADPHDFQETRLCNSQPLHDDESASGGREPLNVAAPIGLRLLKEDENIYHGERIVKELSEKILDRSLSHQTQKLNNNSLRESLDSGMIALRQWLRAQPFPIENKKTDSMSSWEQHNLDSNDMPMVLTDDSLSSSLATPPTHFSSDQLSIIGHHHHYQQQPQFMTEETCSGMEYEMLLRQRSLSEPDTRFLAVSSYPSSPRVRRRRGKQQQQSPSLFQEEVPSGRPWMGEENVGFLSKSCRRRAFTNENSPFEDSYFSDDSSFHPLLSSPFDRQKADDADMQRTQITVTPIDNIPCSTQQSEQASTRQSLHSRQGLNSSTTRDTTTTTASEHFSNSNFVNSRTNTNANTNLERNQDETSNDRDPHRYARLRWIQINRRFQRVITFVALIFSLLLFTILIGWVILTIAYLMSIGKPCDIPLKAYYWLVTFQLVLDVFRTDIMRCMFHWDSSSSQQIPFRVVAYNVAYLLYALMVLRFGILTVFEYDENVFSCRETATDLFNSTVVFVVVSIAAWSTIIGGYLIPFCVVACLLTCNGYNPSSIGMNDSGQVTNQAVFPVAYTMNGAPPDCIDQIPVIAISTQTYPATHPLECCICMDEFKPEDVVVKTKCHHVFHKCCCQEWLRQARTCPVCRDDIPSSHPSPLGSSSGLSHPVAAQPTMIPVGPTGRPVVGLIRMVQNVTRSVTGVELPSGSQRSIEQNDSAVGIAARVTTHHGSDAPALMLARGSSVVDTSQDNLNHQAPLNDMELGDLRNYNEFN